jgi:hypothetical protein
VQSALSARAKEHPRLRLSQIKLHPLHQRVQGGKTDLSSARKKQHENSGQARITMIEKNIDASTS